MVGTSTYTILESEETKTFDFHFEITTCKMIVYSMITTNHLKKAALTQHFFLENLLPTNFESPRNSKMPPNK